MSKFPVVAGVLLVHWLAHSVLGQGRITLEPDVRALILGEGNTQTLNCSVTINTDLGNLVWRGIGITNQARSKVMNSDGTSTYTQTITVSPQLDETIYTCAYNPVSGMPEERDIKIYRASETKMEAEFFYRNKTGTLACSLTLQGISVTASFREWYKGEMALSSMEDKERFVEYNNGTLLIKEPTREDTGMYYANYDINGLAEVTSYNCSVVYRSTPLVLDFSKSRNILEEESLDITCKIIGYPKSNVTWKLRDQVLVPDGDHIVMEDYEGHTNAHLMISSLSIDDEGKYVCIATNEANESDEKSVLVRVKGRLAWLWPLIGIICEAVVLVVVIFLCEKFRNNGEKQSTD